MEESLQKSSRDVMDTNISDVIDECPIFISKVHVNGIHRTSPSLIRSLLAPSLHCQTFKELRQGIKSVSWELERLELFKNITITFQASESHHHLDDDESVPLDVVIDVKEKHYRIKTGTEWRQNEIVLSAGGTKFNVFGYGERLEGSLALGSETSTPFSIHLIKPMITKGLDRRLQASIYQNISNLLGGWSYKEASLGSSFSYHFLNGLGSHQFAYDLVWRHVFDILPSASPSVRREAGHSLKSALKYSFARGSRDDPLLPSRGYHLRFSEELAGVGGTEQFSKSELGYQLHLPLFNLATLSLSSRGSFLLPLGSQQSSRISDRSFIGGPLSVRGFSLNGIGPRDQSDALGGDVSLEAAASLNFFVVPAWDFMKGHVFCNAGNLARLNSANSLLSGTDSLLKFLKDSDVSIGYGIIFKVMNMARLELNCSYPIQIHETSRFHPGLQFGLGLNFL